MMKKLLSVLSILFLFVVVGCNASPIDKDVTEKTCPAPVTCPEPEKCPDPVTCPEPTDLTPSPEGTPIVYHWVPDAITANVTATLDLKEASEDSIKILLGGKVLENILDYELVEGTLTIFGQTLSDLGLVVGSYPVTVVTEQGTDEFTIEVVKDASEATSVATKTIKDVDMTTVLSYVPTEVIANAPELMITEVGVDMYEYSYIEVFNNTTETYNLKNHRIVFSDLTKQTMITNELFEQPLGMSNAVYIYQDYEIPALSSAVVWVVGSYPWAQAKGTLLDGSDGRVMSETEDAAVHLFGTSDENLSVAKFRNVYGLEEDVLVFPVRPQAALMNGTYNSDDLGFGGSPVKSSKFVTFNSKIENRGVQIQKFDLEKKIPVTGVEDVSYFKYEVGVLNQEEVIYADGTFDRNQIEVYGGRETVNVFYARKVLYNSSDEVVGYATGADAIDVYNANKDAYLAMYSDIVTPISSALIYGTYEDVEGVTTLTNWGGFRSLEYTIPASADSTLMRYIPLAGTRSVYETQLASETTGALKLLGLAPEVAEINADSDLIVPESGAYSTDYLSNGYNTIGRGISANFSETVAE